MAIDFVDDWIAEHYADEDDFLNDNTDYEYLWEVDQRLQRELCVINSDNIRNFDAFGTRLL